MKNFVIIMPMAGRGMRFKKFGYNTPKPLIKINQWPMFVKSSMVFSKRLKRFFIVQKSLNKNKIFKKYIKLFKDKKIIILKKYTNGQASTVAKSVKFLKKEQVIIVHSCDLSFKINLKEVRKKLKNYDVVVFTAKGKNFNYKNPSQFSWVRKNPKNNEVEISLKKNFNKNKKNNRVLVGSFIFRNKEILNKSINYIKKNKLMVKNEYYLDHAALISKKIRFKLGEIIVKKYQSWGSHTELKNLK
jgi:bifunctional N-acetylglucosamine-1-phosphate-uridyltransferase/glucosamine-1-phosphate-acetyltransferase GlmU-like protein